WKQGARSLIYAFCGAGLSLYQVVIKRGLAWISTCRSVSVPELINLCGVPAGAITIWPAVASTVSLPTVEVACAACRISLEPTAGDQRLPDAPHGYHLAAAYGFFHPQDRPGLLLL